MADPITQLRDAILPEFVRITGLPLEMPVGKTWIQRWRVPPHIVMSPTRGVEMTANEISTRFGGQGYGQNPRTLHAFLQQVEVAGWGKDFDQAWNMLIGMRSAISNVLSEPQVKWYGHEWDPPSLLQMGNDAIGIRFLLTFAFGAKVVDKPIQTTRTAPEPGHTTTFEGSAETGCSS